MGLPTSSTGGVCLLEGSVSGGLCLGVCVLGSVSGGLCKGSLSGGGSALAATAVVGMHPTGMHSCFCH